MQSTYFQGWEFAHSLIAHLLILLKSNERLWAICSDHSRQMSDHKQIAQVAQSKWATVSEWLRSLKTNEPQYAICSGRSWANELFAQKIVAKKI